MWVNARRPPRCSAGPRPPGRWCWCRSAARDDHLGVDDDVAAAVDLGDEAVEAAGGRAALLLADPVVLRAVAGALEPLRALAPRDTAAQVDALLVEGDDALLMPLISGGVGQDLLGRRAPRPSGRAGCRSGRRRRRTARCSRRCRPMMSSSLPALDLVAEAARERRPQEGHGGGAEAGERHGHGGDDAPVEHLAAGDAEALLVGRQRRRRGRAPRCRGRRGRVRSRATVRSSSRPVWVPVDAPTGTGSLSPARRRSAVVSARALPASRRRAVAKRKTAIIRPSTTRTTMRMVEESNVAPTGRRRRRRARGR